MKKILITASTFPRWEKDTEPRFVLDYAKAISKWYDVTVLAPAALGACEKEEIEGIKVVRYHYFPVHKWETLCYPGAIVPRIKEKKLRLFLVPCLFLALRHYLKKHSSEYDLVHAHWIIPQGMCQATIKDVPYIVTGHGGDVTSLNKSFIKKAKIKCLKNAAAITVVSDALDSYIQNMYTNEKTSVISMGCDVSAFSPENRVKKFYGEDEKKTVLFVGRLAEKKGVTYLIDAMKDVENGKLMIVGGGPLEENLKRQVIEAGLSDKVTFLGPKSHEELKTVYASADIFCAPSITASDGDKEGFGLVILEAMASGIPVIASNSGGIPDIIKNTQNGILVEEKDVDGLSAAINELIRNDSYKEKLVENGYKTADKFSYTNIGNEYNRIIEKVLSSCK